jgi:hypothetical protein
VIGRRGGSARGVRALAVDSSPTARADAMYRAGELFRRRSRRGRDPPPEATLRISDTTCPRSTR